MPDTLDMTPQQTAEKVVEIMKTVGGAVQSMGAEYVSVAPGAAKLRLQITESHTNIHNTCHGGILFTLADSALGLAANSYNQNAVTTTANIDYLAPAKLGDVLLAEAQERRRSPRSGLYDVSITNQDGILIAVFRGNIRVVAGTHF